MNDLRHHIVKADFDDNGNKDYGVEFVWNNETDSCIVGLKSIDALVEVIKKENLSLIDKIEFKSILSEEIEDIINVFKKAKRNDAWDYDTFLDKNNIHRGNVYSVFVTHMILEDMIANEVFAKGVC